MEVPNPNEQVALSAIKKGLRTSRFTFFLDKKSPKTYAELLTRAQKYASVEEQAAERRRAERRTAPKKENQQTFAARPPRDGAPINRRRSPKPRDLLDKFETCTPLAYPRERILMEIENDDIIRRPQPMRAPPTIKNQSRY